MDLRRCVWHEIDELTPLALVPPVQLQGSTTMQVLHQM
jgi:hypothetical protein